MDIPEPSKTLDVVGLLCPLPVMKAKRAIADMGEGEVLEILADDPETEIDMPTWAKREGHELLKTEKDGEVFRFYIRKGD
ncbi:MAG: sulfurtransferase TusA family protein [Candidatus Hydrothermarchaeales archaeon]